MPDVKVSIYPGVLMKKLMVLLCVLAGFNNLEAMQITVEDADANTSDAKAPKKSIADGIQVHTVLELTQKMAELANQKASSIADGIRPGDDEKLAITRILAESMRAAHQHVTAFKQALGKISDEDFIAQVTAAQAKARTDHVMTEQHAFKTFDSIKAVVAAIKTFGEQAVKDTDALVKKFDAQFNTVIVVTGGADAESDDDLGASDAGQTA